MKSYITLFLSIFLLTSCGPVYRTFYTYTPPASPYGMSCIAGCASAKQQCMQEERRIYQHCLDRVAYQEAECERNKIYARNPKHPHRPPECVENCYCFSDSCDEPDSEGCDEIYRNCYVGCGGRVDSYVKCVEFCDQQ